MEALWGHGASSVREIQERFPEKDRPAYTTVQTMVYRLEGKKAVRRVRKIGNAHIFEALVSPHAAPLRAPWSEPGKLTLEDVKEAEQVLRKLARKDKSS